MARILVIERTGTYSDALKKRYEVTSVPSGKKASSVFAEGGFSVVVLDAISMRTPGDRIAQQLKENLGTVPLIHLHPGAKDECRYPGGCRVVSALHGAQDRQQYRALLHPVTGGLNCDLRTVYGQFVAADSVRQRAGDVADAEARLLVETFFRHPGETLDRKVLMERVWDTSYLGDTRTLDVHVRWIRRAIEENPGSPRTSRRCAASATGWRLPVAKPSPENAALTLQEM